MDAAALGNMAAGDSSPQHMAQDAARFLREHVQMSDVLLYMRDLLKTYAALQTFEVCDPVRFRV